MKPLNIVFAGTPAFTCPALDALYASEHRLSAIYTQPDRPKGRGRAIQASAAKTWGLRHNIPIFQPLNFKDKASHDALRELQPDVLVVIAYGLILPAEILNIPKLGCINVHASLLPHWRGAAPIQYSLLHGDKTTGVSIMQMDSGMDTGPVLHMKEMPIPQGTTAGELHDALAELACEPLIKVLNTLATEGHITATEQDHNAATYAPKIKKEDARIHWTQSAHAILCQVLAFNPWPVAHTTANNETVRVHYARVIEQNTSKAPGTILDISPTGLQVATGDGVLNIETLQFAGGKAITVTDWLNANKTTLYPGLCLT